MHRPRRILRFTALVISLLTAVAAAASERPMLGELKENETVVIDYFSRTGNRTLSRQYFIRGGGTKLLIAHRNTVEWRNQRPQVTNKYLLGDLELSRDDVLGLEALLVFYSARLPGACGIRDLIQVEFYRDGRSIGQFTYQDDTCYLRNKDAAEVREKTRGKIDDALMDLLMTFADLDERVRAANP